tara:strand:+ start:741 stop:1235 length:495 start_codon:yes stop_codon:yes gene_type:complete
MSVVKELKNTPQKIAEKKEENKRIKIKDVVFFDKGGVDIFQQWVVKRLEWSVTLSRAPVHRSERWWSQTLDHRLIGLMAVASRYNILPEQYCQNEKDKNYVSMKTVHNLCTASHTTLQKIVSDGVARGDLLPLVTKNGDKRQSIFTASDSMCKAYKNIKSWTGF